MTTWHKNLKSRFVDFPPHQQLLMIVNELNRANNMRQSITEYHNALERALELLDYSLASPHWLSRGKEILRARDLVAKFYISEPTDNQQLQKTIVALHPDAFKMLYPLNLATLPDPSSTLNARIPLKP